MRVIVNQDGVVRDVQIEDGNPQLAPAALDAVPSVAASRLTK